MLTNNPWGTQTTSPNTNNHTNLIVSGMEAPRSSPEFNPQERTEASPSNVEPSPTNVPLLPRRVINREDSLPSYEDAVRIMQSAPPKE